MPTKRQAPGAAKPAQNLFNPWTMAADYGQQQMAVATESAGAMFRGFEAMRKIQEQAGNRTMMLHAAALEKMQHAKEPAQLMAVQSELLGQDTECAARYWQELSAAALEMQTQMLSCCSHLVDSEAVMNATAAMDHFPAAFTGLNGFFGRQAAQAREWHT